MTKMQDEIKQLLGISGAEFTGTFNNLRFDKNGNVYIRQAVKKKKKTKSK